MTEKINLDRYLYILPFDDDEHFKIGIWGWGDLQRVKNHQSTYGIKKDNSLIITATRNRTIEILERHLLNIFDEQTDKYMWKDGYTEIRHISNLAECISEIYNQNKRLWINIYELNKLRGGGLEKIKMGRKKTEEEKETEIINRIIK